MENMGSAAQPDEDGISVVVVPEQHRQEVIAFVKSLSQDEHDVTGYLLGGVGTSVTASGSRLQAGSSGSGCKFTESKKGFDWDCFDYD